MDMSLVPYVIEQTSRGERSYDIFSRLFMNRSHWHSNTIYVRRMYLQFFKSYQQNKNYHMYLNHYHWFLKLNYMKHYLKYNYLL